MDDREMYDYIEVHIECPACKTVHKMSVPMALFGISLIGVEPGAKVVKCDKVTVMVKLARFGPFLIQTGTPQEMSRVPLDPSVVEERLVVVEEGQSH